MKIAQDINVDGVTIVITESKDGSQPQMGSVLQFTDKELQVPPAQIQQLLFRELASSNRIMVCTGFQYGNKWYGDRPDNGAYENPFKGTTEYFGKKPVIKPTITVQEGWQGLQLSIIGIPLEDDKFLKLTNVNWNNQTQDSELVSGKNQSQVENAYDALYESSSVVVSYANEFTLTFVASNNRKYQVTLPKVKDTSGLGTFELSADSLSLMLQQINDVAIDDGEEG